MGAASMVPSLRWPLQWLPTVAALVKRAGCVGRECAPNSRLGQHVELQPLSKDSLMMAAMAEGGYSNCIHRWHGRLILNGTDAKWQRVLHL
mmetsp:Transcript_106270/g.205769  ORF Transcript_106270/g.205769 Transcript_106270/m.205769 type:complete len:91 (+) Transcript_106270:60-332(+)